MNAWPIGAIPCHNGNAWAELRLSLPKPAKSAAKVESIVQPQDGAGSPSEKPGVADVLIEARSVSVFYNTFEAIKKVSLTIPRNRVIAMIGPSGCGKSTFLRSINRLNDLIPGCRVAGDLLIGGQNIYEPGIDLVSLRRQVGLVFQKPNPFPKSIYDNIAYGPRLQGIRRRGELDAIVEDCLKRSALWEEVKDRLASSALGMSGGQQQRLCIARCALATSALRSCSWTNLLQRAWTPRQPPGN